MYNGIVATLVVLFYLDIFGVSSKGFNNITMNISRSKTATNGTISFGR